VRWPWQTRLVRGKAIVERLPLDRVVNELNQLRAIRDDRRVTPGSPLHSWLNGAIFALEWARDPYGSLPASDAARQRQLGIESCEQP